MGGTLPQAKFSSKQTTPRKSWVCLQTPLKKIIPLPRSRWDPSDCHCRSYCRGGCRDVCPPRCIICEKAKIGDGVILQANVYVGRHATVGNSCKFHVNAVFQDYCVAGTNVVLQSGCIIGSDGYGFITEGGVHSKIPQIGNVVLEDEVEVGANSTIDRARFHETRIGKGTKIDNLVQIGHNVTIGKNGLLVALVGIGGSTKIGDNVILAGQSGVAGHLEIGDGAQIAAKTAVTSSLGPWHESAGDTCAALQ